MHWIHFAKKDVIARSRRRRGNLVWNYKLHPCNLPFWSHKVRSILLQAKLVPRSLRLPRNDGIHTGLLRSYKISPEFLETNSPHILPLVTLIDYPFPEIPKIWSWVFQRVSPRMSTSRPAIHCIPQSSLLLRTMNDSICYAHSVPADIPSSSKYRMSDFPSRRSDNTGCQIVRDL